MKRGERHPDGLALVVSAPSGTGKTTALKRLKRFFPGSVFSVSCTTRAKRPGEREGRAYHFIGRQRFRAMTARGEFLEWAEVYGNLYGTPRKPVAEALRQGRLVLFDVDHQGAQKLRKILGGDAVLVMLLPPSAHELRRRLEGRGGMHGEALRRRLREAALAAAAHTRYDYVVLNDSLEHCVAALRAIVGASRLQSRKRRALAERFIRECRREKF